MNTWSFTLQNAASPTCEMMIFFHDLTMMIIFSITLMISIIMYFLFQNKMINRFLLNNHSLELIWTIIPMFILIFIAFPSIKILYLIEETHMNKITIKAKGSQWFWSYEYSEIKNIEFDAFMTPTNALSLSDFRLLDVDNRCILPLNFPIRILTTSIDVIHAWTVPSLGIKMDSTPGRLNQTFFYINRPGLYFGQCSEICGINHSFMPIVIEATNTKNFTYWLMNFE